MAELSHTSKSGQALCAMCYHKLFRQHIPVVELQLFYVMFYPFKVSTAAGAYGVNRLGVGRRKVVHALFFHEAVKRDPVLDRAAKRDLVGIFELIAHGNATGNNAQANVAIRRNFPENVKRGGFSFHGGI